MERRRVGGGSAEFTSAEGRRVPPHKGVPPPSERVKQHYFIAVGSA
jgi:hypothetical protein